MSISVRSTLGWVGQVIAWLVILGVVVALAAAVLVPRLAGATPYTVLTGSMQPKYPPGTLVVVKPVEFDDIGLNDVITYQRESGEAAVVTHRVVGTGSRFDGTRTVITQGDANDDPDRDPVLAVQVKGELWYSVPYLGYVNTALSGSQRQWAVLGVSAALVGYAAYMFVGAFRDRRRSRRTSSVEVAEHETSTPPMPAPVAGQKQHHPRNTQVVRPAGSNRSAVAGTAVGLAVLVAGFVLIRRLRRRSGTGPDAST